MNPDAQQGRCFLRGPFPADLTESSAGRDGALVGGEEGRPRLSGPSAYLLNPLTVWK